MHFNRLIPNPRLAAGMALALSAAAHAEDGAVTPKAGHSESDAGFKIDPVPPPSTNDAATAAKFSLVDGTRDPNGGELSVLHDGVVPKTNDEPAANFFFRGGSNGGRIAIDLGEVTAVAGVHTYSWHSGSRGPQVFTLFASDGEGDDFQKSPKRDVKPAEAGWQKIASVDTRSDTGDGGGQHAVAIAASEGEALGKFRYLLFDIETATGQGPFGDTFFSEVDVLAVDGPEPEPIKEAEKILKEFPAKDGKYHYVLDATIAPDLLEWSEKELLPVVEEWYPKIVEMLPSDGYMAPENVLLEFRDDMGGTPAYATGNRVAMSAPWFRNELEREARGCVVHELVHVVQNYWRARHTNRNPSRTPGWVTEGIADYIRWFLYEPETRGAEITRRNVGNAKFDASYRTTANFLNWVVENRDKDLLRKLNAAAREGKYSEDLWNEWTGKTAAELGSEWQKENETRLNAANEEAAH